MPARPFDVQQVMFDESGIQISYVNPDDIKDPGIVHAHTLAVPLGSHYDQEIQNVIEALVYLLNDVLEDWDSLPPFNDQARPDDEGGLERSAATERPTRSTRATDPERPDRPVMGQ